MKKNDMTFVVCAGTVFGPRLWQLSACQRSLAGILVNSFLLKLKRQTEHLDLFFLIFTYLTLYILAMYIQANLVQTIWYPFHEWL